MAQINELTRKTLGLPDRVFLYTLDQICMMLSLDEKTFGKVYCHYDARFVGRRPLDKLKVVNIAPSDSSPDWRVEESELARWMKHKGFRRMTRQL